MSANLIDDEIKEVPDIPQGVLRAASEGKLVVFVGAGIPRIIGCPSWKEFALLQLQDLKDKRAINYYEYKNLESMDARKLLSICRRIYEEKQLQPLSIKSLLRGKDDLIGKFTIYKDLYAFKVIYVTTNYDDYLDLVVQKPVPRPTASAQTLILQEAEKDTSRTKVFYSKEELLISNLTNGNIIHLHGSINDESNTVVTIVDYMNHYERDSKPAVLVEEIFKSYTVLFVGYGLEEFEILEFMISKSQTIKDELKHFMLYPIFGKEVNLLRFQRRYYADLGIHLIPYLIDENGYEQLATIFHQWAKQIGPISRPLGFLDRIKLIDEVL